MGDITPKPKRPPEPDPGENRLQDSALGEAPGSSVSMPDIAGWNAEASEPTPPPKGYFPPVDLIGAWQRASAPPPPPQAAAAQATVGHPGAHDEEEVSGHHPPVSNRLLVIITTLGIVAVAGLGSTYFLFLRPEPTTQPVAVTAPSPKPSVRPTFRPSPKPSAHPTPPSPAAPPPAAPGQRTYTVVPGDTLITIGEKLNVDWRAIAAANGQITDPNFITPGQVLKIP